MQVTFLFFFFFFFVVSDAIVPYVITGNNKAVNSTHLSHRDKILRRVYEHMVRHQSRIYDTEETKYLIYSDAMGGVGNKIFGLISTLVLALITDRVVVVESSEFDGEFVPAFPWKIDFKKHFRQSDLDARKTFNFECCRTQGWEEREKHFQETKQLSFLDLDLSSDSLYHHFGCWDVKKLVGESKFAQLTTNQWLSHMTYNAHHQDFFQRLFEGEPIFTTLAQVFFHFTPDIQARFDQVTKKLGFGQPGNYFVGLQVRTEYAKTPAQQVTFFGCGLRAALEAGIPEKNIKFFLASDSKEFKEEMKKNPSWGNKLVEFNGEGYSYNEVRLFDIWLLASCDVIVMTSGSTFGASAAAIGFKRAYELTPEERCFQKINLDPCSHYSWVLKESDPKCFNENFLLQADFAVCRKEFFK
eukprot:TRINITY_DN4876_c0_g1_i1.p1 TRINITY_DN4876_c0_g1~~TRINITY_DN4876_c0_g1_i1.p1  ORF type:complete len:413 (-),score=87.68 TRINITY_DN4876_c0_g1_i1:192-1430(-)